MVFSVRTASRISGQASFNCCSETGAPGITAGRAAGVSAVAVSTRGEGDGKAVGAADGAASGADAAAGALGAGKSFAGVEPVPDGDAGRAAGVFEMAVSTSGAGAADAAVSKPADGPVVATDRAAEAAAATGAAATPSTPMRRSRRSTRASAPRVVSSVAGIRARAIMSSRCSRGEVAPLISVSAAFRMSAVRESSAGPKAAAWPFMRSSSSCGTPRSTAAAPATLVADTMIRSRMRSSRSSTNRRGSCPVWMTRSTASNAAAGSRAPMA